MKIKVGFVGCGGIARWHVSHLEKMDDVAIVAACDVIPERAEALAKPFGARTYTCHNDMYENEDLDAVFICIPPDQHTDTETAAVARGFHIFVQKPMALCMEKAHEVADAIEKAGVVSAVGFQDRYLDISDSLIEFLKDKKVGLFTGAWVGGVPGVPWWPIKAQSGGQVVEQTIHLYDMARMYFGEVETVYCASGKGIVQGVENYDVEDYSSVTMTFANGIVGTITTGDYLTEAAPRNGLEIYTPEVRIEYELRSAVRYYSRTRSWEERRVRDQGYDCDRAFIDAVKAKDPTAVRSPYKDALRSLAVTLAANKSMETGQAVKVEY
ncbi:MAG: Gfo/Idh/MocA family oxidoreductase [Firmicutes bacterium]|nr:Gfo/Idh/MocA family oxidoreductase [Bacillota bacterium]